MKALLLLAATIAMFSAANVKAEGLPQDIANGGLFLKCYSVHKENPSWNNWFPKQEQKDLERFRVSPTKFVFRSLAGRTVIETDPNMTAVSRTTGYLVHVKMGYKIQKFDVSSGGMVSIDGKDGAIVGQLPDARSTGGTSSTVVACGFETR